MVFRPGVEGQRTSDALGWTTMFASSQLEPPYEGSFAPVRDQLLVWHRDGPALIEGEGGEKRFRRAVPPGGIHLIPGGAGLRVNLHHPLETMHIYLRRSVLEEVAADITCGDPAMLRIAPRLLDVDVMLSKLLGPLDCALQEGNAESALGIDYLSFPIAAHLIRLYSNARLATSSQKRACSSPALDRAVQFMRAHLHDSISLADIARAAALSSSQLVRLFNGRYGLSPHRFLINMRVEQAKRLLEATDLPIAEIALECGFCHQEHLTHQFRRACGTTPAAFRRDRWS